MKSNDEEYLDSLLSSAQKSNNSNPMSALSRMSGKSNTSGSVGSGDIGMLVNNSNGNQDLNDIGSILDRLDRDELVDDRMSGLLDSISRPTNPGIPKFTVGGNRTSGDTRDPEEIALDEAIADAERLDAEIRSGKFDNVPSRGSESYSDAPIVDIEEGDDALLEMAPEVSLPEDNTGAAERDNSSDANETPEQILTDLLDDMPDGGLMQADEGSVEESLRDVLDNMKDEAEEDPGMTSSDDNTQATQSEDDSLSEGTKPVGPQDGSGLDDIDLDSISLEDLEASMGQMMDKGSSAESKDFGMPEDIPAAVDETAAASETDAGDGADEPLEDLEAALDDLGLEGFTLDGGSEGEESLDAAVSDSAESAGDLGLDALTEELPQDTTSDSVSDSPSQAHAEPSLDSMSEEDFDLGDFEASLDELMGPEEPEATSTEGEVAEVAGTDAAQTDGGSDQGEVSMQDLDALMNSLANDEIEDIESTIDKDIESGHADESEIPKEDILGALTENGFDDLGEPEPSLDELASIPERPSRGGGGGSLGGSGDDDGDGDDGKKKKKKGFFARLFAALVKEDEESEGELKSLSAENQQVLDELGEEGAPKGKKKKEKKEKKKKEKKPKKEKPPKEKKPPKPKKEKKPKPPKEPGAPEKAISPKKIALSGIFAASLGILVLIPSLVLPDRIATNSANAAYNHREYTTAYKLLYGKKLDEDQSLVYEQSRVLAWAQRYLDGYENYTAMNMKEEALDMLLMAMRNKDDLIAEAQKYSVEIEVNSVYDSIISVLSQNYGLSDSDIVEINSIKKDRDYTIRLMEIVGTLES